MIEKEVYRLEELGREYRELVGNKSANLGEMLKVKEINVPTGFAVSVSACERFVRETGTLREMKQYLGHARAESLSLEDIEGLQEVSLRLRRIIESQGMPENLKQDIETHYKSMCGKCNVENMAVSVRSAGAVSHPGQYETYLNVVGIDSILEKIVKVWSSIYNTKSICAALRQAIPVEDCPPVGVCVLKMVNARAAGVCLTVHPITGDDSQALVESCPGLGESVVSGAVIPDKFVIDKVEMRVKEVVPGQKKKQIVAAEQGIIERAIPLAEQNNLSISEEEAIDIVDQAKRLESHFGAPQDIEWAIDVGLPPHKNIMMLQTRRQVGIPEKKSAVDKIMDMMITRYREIR